MISHVSRRKSGVVALAGVFLLMGSILAGEPRQLWHSYLTASVFVISIGLGGMFFVLVHHLSRAGWSVVLRRQAEHVMATLPVLLLLLVPLAFELEALYPWADPETVAADPLLAHKASYLNPAAFRIRGAIYLAGWTLIAWWFRRKSLEQDERADLEPTRKLQAASAPALLFFGFSITFAGIDGLMSLDPHWYSSIFGVYVFSGSVLSYLAAQALASLWWKRRESDLPVTAEHFHGLGKLVFGFVCFWAYIGFSQFLLIWYANIPEETVWYARRLEGSWYGMSVLLAVGHFVLPFFFLLPQKTKRRPRALALAAAWLVLMHYLDLHWLILPELHPRGVTPHWLDLTTLAGAVAVLAGTVGLLSSRAPLVPVSDPRLEESLSFDNA